MEQKHVDEIWAIVATAGLSGEGNAATSSSTALQPQGMVDVINAGAPTASAASSSTGAAAVGGADGAEATETSGERSGTCLPLWCRPDWGDFEDDRSMLKGLVAWVHSNDGASPGSRSSKYI